MLCVIDYGAIKEFLAGKIGIEAFRDASADYFSETRALVGLIILSYWKVGDAPVIEVKPLGILMRSVYPLGGAIKTDTIITRSYTLGWHKSNTRGRAARATISLPDEAKALLADYDGTPPGVAAFLRAQPLNLD